MHNLIEFLERTCDTHGNKTAVEAADSSFTYAQLRSVALQIAAAIPVAIGCGKRNQSTICKERIGVYLPKGSKCLSAMLGVLYCGSAYVPLDLRAPINRTKLMIETVDPRLIITDEEGKRILSESGVP